MGFSAFSAHESGRWLPIEARVDVQPAYAGLPEADLSGSADTLKLHATPIDWSPSKPRRRSAAIHVFLSNSDLPLNYITQKYTQMSDENTRYTNWGAITVLATGLKSVEDVKSAIHDLAQERFEIEIKGSPRFTNGTTGYVLSRDGELERWEYVGSMGPAENEQVQILEIGPGGNPLDDEEEEGIYELDDETENVPRDENGRPTSDLLSVHEVNDDIEKWMADAVKTGIEAWERWNTQE